MNFINCPLCGGNKVAVFEVGEAEQDTLTKETWFTSQTQFYCRCMNEKCVHDSAYANTYEEAVELWNQGIVYKWEQSWLRRRHSTDAPTSDFY